MRVLLAEDDAVTRTILRRSVEKLGHECLTAEDGGAALEIYRSTPGVDLVISDWMLWGVDDYLSKPLDRDELQVRLASAYRVTRLHRRLASQNEQLAKLNERLFQESRTR